MFLYIGEQFGQIEAIDRWVAEFVGDEDTVTLLRQFGVDFAQGYHIGMPRRALPPSARFLRAGTYEATDRS